ncbi:MAG: hypothetical protein WCX74_02350 [Candidatus Paceibacterota bacterium]
MKNILGWILLAIGLVMIFGDIFVTYNYFTGKDKFPEIFKEQFVALNNKTTNIGGGDVQGQMNEAIGNAVKDQLNQALPSSSILLVLNASLWSIFAFFLLSAGGKLVRIGGSFISNKKDDE